MRALKLCVFTLLGVWLGSHAGRPLDSIFAGEGTIAIVGLVFGGWAGSMIGGSGWADTVSSFRRRSESKMAASLAIPLAVSAGTVAVAKIAGSATILSGFLVGAAIMAYLLARKTRFRFIFAALLIGAFVGAAISAAGGIAAVERVAQTLNQAGLDLLIERSQSDGLRHLYLGRDREALFIGTVFLGYGFVCAVTMIAFFVLGTLGVSIDRRNRSAKSKRKRSEMANTAKSQFATPGYSRGAKGL